MKSVFVSDIHITSRLDSKHEVFCKLLVDLAQDKDLSHLFLVGDIFDLWLWKHDYFIQEYSKIVSLLQDLCERGVKVIFFEGNHDLYLKEFWTDLGVEVCEGPKVFQLGHLKVLVEHGDQSNPEDRGYLFLRWILRTAPLKLLVRILPSSLVVLIGQRSSQASRRYTSTSKGISTHLAIDKLRAHALRQAEIHDFDLLINGHVHILDDFKFHLAERPRRAVNLGSWFDGAKAFILSDKVSGEFLSLDPKDSNQNLT